MVRVLIFLFPLLLTTAVEPLAAAVASLPSIRSSESDPIRIGIIGLDTSHSVHFTRTINAPNAEGLFARYEVVAAYPYGSRTIESSYERIPDYIEEIAGLGVEVVNSIDELLERVDFVLLETNDGKPHLSQALRIIEAGKPFFLDKPVAASLSDVVAIYEAAERAGVPMFSSSSLRYMPNAQAIRGGSIGQVKGAFAYSPAPTEPSHPDLYWYGIHGAEILFTVMGTGCETVVRTHTVGADVVTCTWEDGRIGTVHGIRDGKRGYGGTAFGTDAIAEIGPYEGYQTLLEAILTFFETGEAPISAEETIEIYAFMSAADESKRRGGQPVRISTVLDDARKEAGKRLGEELGALTSRPGTGQPDVRIRSATSRGATDAGTRPNILFVFTDDHATHAIGAYNERLSGVAPTPNIDRLANEGMLFRNAFVTNSICAPSRAVILTGKHSHLNGVIDNRETFDGSQTTFPKLLQDAGYTTAIVGKWHLKSDPTGFDYWNILPGQGSYYNPDMIDNGVRKQHTGYVTDIVTDAALDWLQQERDESKPFMLMYQQKAPHRSWQPGPDHLTLFDDADIPEPSTLLDPWIDRTVAADWQAMTIERHLTENDLKLVPPGNLNDDQLRAWNAAYGPKNRALRQADLVGDDLVRWKYQRYMKDYLRTIASVDDNLGRVLDYLDESGLAENTIVVYSSDQGFYLGEHGWFDKRWMYEESLRMPLVVRWPGVTDAGSVNTDLVQNLDFAETFLDAAGASIPAEMQGRSLVPLLKGDTPTDWRDAIYYHYYEFPGWHDVRRHYGVRTDRFKLIHYYGIDEWELFDLEHDPDELDNVYGDAGYGNVAAQLKQKIAELQDRYDLDEYEESPTAPDPRNVAPEQVLSLSPSSLPLQIVEVIDPTYRPLTVTARVRPSSENGVIFSHGGDAMGYSLYLEEGRPHFVINNRRVYFRIAGAEALPQNTWTNVAASIDQEGVIRLFVDGSEVGQANGNLMSARPAERIMIGDDADSTIIEYGFDTRFSGAIENVELHWGRARP